MGRSLHRDGQEGKLEFEDVRIGEMAGGSSRRCQVRGLEKEGVVQGAVTVRTSEPRAGGGRQSRGKGEGAEEGQSDPRNSPDF